jgi:uncharacterized membrane protein
MRHRPCVFWQLTMPRALLMALILVVGIFIGLLLKKDRRIDDHAQYHQSYPR